MDDLEWFESQSGNHPVIGYFPSSHIWYAEVVIGDISKGEHKRITGNGKTMLRAIGDCRTRVALLQVPAAV